MQKVLAIDLDGTLLYPYSFRHKVSKKNVKFLQRWIDAGNRVVLVSSRDAKFLREVEKEIERPVDVIAPNHNPNIVSPQRDLQYLKRLLLNNQ